MDKPHIIINESKLFIKELVDPIRTLRTNLLTKNENVSSIAFTSTTAGEGKTMLSFLFAMSLSQCGKKTVWINCDLHKESKLFTYKPETLKGEKKMGLSEYLKEKCGLDQIIYGCKEKNLDVIPSGEKFMAVGDLFEEENFLHFLKEMKSNYDYVILDSPAVENHVETTIIGSKCDGIVFVIQHNKVKRTKAAEAVEMLKNNNGNIVGAVLNNIPPR